MGKSSLFAVEPGMKGILISCFRRRESSCVMEAYNLFDEYYESLGYTCADKDEQVEQKSIEEQVEQELQELRSKKQKTKRFLNMPMGDLECLVFIKTCSQLIPSTFITGIFEDLRKSKINKTRFCHRMIPIDYSCYANMKDLKAIFESIAGQYFPAESVESKTYCLSIESRFNSSLNKDDIIKEITFLIPSVHKVSFKDPMLTVSIQIFKNICGLSVLENYDEFRKFNIQQITSTKEN